MIYFGLIYSKMTYAKIYCLEISCVKNDHNICQDILRLVIDVQLPNQFSYQLTEVGQVIVNSARR